MNSMQEKVVKIIRHSCIHNMADGGVFGETEAAKSIAALVESEIEKAFDAAREWEQTSGRNNMPKDMVQFVYKFETTAEYKKYLSEPPQSEKH